MLNLAAEEERLVGKAKQTGVVSGFQLVDGKERAAHEAAHAVLARLFNFPVKSARIIDDDPEDLALGSTGIVWGERPADPTERRGWAEKIVQVCFAGFWATCGESPESEQWKRAMGGMRDDVFHAYHVLIKNIEACSSLVRRDRLLREGSQRAKELVMKTSIARDRLADELLKRGRLGEQEIAEIVDPLLPSRTS